MLIVKIIFNLFSSGHQLNNISLSSLLRCKLCRPFRKTKKSNEEKLETYLVTKMLNRLFVFNFSFFHQTLFLVFFLLGGSIFHSSPPSQLSENFPPILHIEHRLRTRFSLLFHCFIGKKFRPEN